MADDKQGRDDQAHNQERRQAERMQEEAVSRADEEEPVPDDSDEQLGELDDALESHDYPTTTDELAEAYGDYDVETQDGTESLAELLSSTDSRTYDTPDDVRSDIRGVINR